MDTDDLSRETYEGILCEVDIKFHDLAIQYGSLAYDCDDEEEYLNEAEKFTLAIFTYEDFELEDLFFGEMPDKEELFSVLEKVKDNIKKIRLIPFEKRHFEEY